MTRVAFLWHMHQPYYEDLVTHEHILPWVRMHALKDYYGMVALLEEFPGMKVTFNLVPSLLVQLEAFAENRARDRYLDVGLKPAAALSADDVLFMLQNFFHAQRQHLIEPHPRYADLLARRGIATAPREREAVSRQFSTNDLRDLQVWQKLAWFDPYYLERDARVRALITKGRDFTEDDKAVLRTVELELLNAVIPAYRERVQAGQIEISTSPFYHPILPLLCDTDIYKRTHPQSQMPRHRFQHPEDALEQLERAAACHERLFGRRPTGLWPSEGSVSDAMVPLAAEAGFAWMATDELILSRSLGLTFGRDGAGHVSEPNRLYAPYRVEAGGAAISCGFRDHVLSDRIGFVYAGWRPEVAADDFVERLVEGGRRAAAPGGADPTVFVILDGENAWEHYEGGGRPFLRALYQRIVANPELTPVTMSEACAAPSRSLNGIFPGSWIDANFYIWIGHQDDRRGWSQLAEARDAVGAPSVADATSIAQAREELLIAEGSDWFWWYGDDHSSDHDAEFDDLFRRHLRNIYRLLRRPVPDELFLGNISASTLPPPQTDPTGLVSPTIDGEDSSYFEWLAAGTSAFRDVAGAMHQTERRTAVLTQLKFGFDRERLFVRLDAADRMDVLLASGLTFSVAFLEPEGVRVVVAGKSAVARLEIRTGPDRWATRAFRGIAVAGTVLEVAIPVADLGANLRTLSFVVTVTDPAGTEIERQPGPRPVQTERPGRDFTARNWTA